ncbi:MAG TPA: amidase [Acidimicrobiales bacterium]|nr:amidase [Acidimicrobiales bacterium]
MPQEATFITRLDHADGARLWVAVKDLIDMAGLPTTSGSKVIAARALPAGHDAACLAGTRVAEAAGEVAIVGKTNMHELAFGVTGINPWFGTPANPFDPRLVPGGSSSGSATAVATDQADVAYGSDTGGSIRIPAACCGIVGLKTTLGRVPLDGVLPLAPSLDTVGPMAATVAGVVAGMRLLEPGFQPASGIASTVGRVRLPAEDWVDTAIDSALRAAGLRTADLALDGWDAATEATAVILGSEAWSIHEALWREHAGELSPDVAARLQKSSTITAAQIGAARAQATAWDVELQQAFARADLLALPTIATTPPAVEDAARLTEIRYVSPFNLAGLPAIALPVATHTTKRRPVPASLQLVAPAGAEELLCATAAAIEEAAGFRP